jgi:DNA repair photolyase
VLSAFHNPLIITTKGALIIRDLDILTEMAERTSLRVNISLATVREDVWRSIEPAAPKPSKRLEALELLAKAGITVGVLLAPIVPGVTDGAGDLEAVVRAAADHGAEFLGSNVLYLKPGTREWFLPYVREAYPHLNPLYAHLYKGPYAPSEYTRRVLELVDGLRRQCGLDERRIVAAGQPAGQQLALV